MIFEVVFYPIKGLHTINSTFEINLDKNYIRKRKIEKIFNE